MNNPFAVCFRRDARVGQVAVEHPGLRVQGIRDLTVRTESWLKAGSNLSKRQKKNPFESIHMQNDFPQLQEQAPKNIKKRSYTEQFSMTSRTRDVCVCDGAMPSAQQLRPPMHNNHLFQRPTTLQ